MPTITTETPDETGHETFTGRLNRLAEQADDARIAAVAELIERELPASDDTKNMRRIVLSNLLAVSLSGAPLEERHIVVAGLLGEVFAKEEKALADAAAGVVELPVPPGLDGKEILRVFREEGSKDIVIMGAPAAAQPPEWGVILHDVASHIADHAVEKHLIQPPQRGALLDTIAASFEVEHEEPRGTLPYKPELHS